MITLKRREIKPVLVSNQDGKLKTDSLIVARVFEKEHFNLMRDIRNITESDTYLKRIKNGTQPNFELCFRINELANGKRVPYYEMDRQGFEILAMGFTGEKALEWKFKYSDAFAAMEELLKKERIVVQDNPFNLEELGLGLLQVGSEQRQTAKQVRCRWVNILQNSIGCGNICRVAKTCRTREIDVFATGAHSTCKEDGTCQGKNVSMFLEKKGHGFSTQTGHSQGK